MTSFDHLPNAGTSPIRPGGPLAGPGASAPSSDGAAFARTLRSAVEQVSRLQHDATQAVEQLALGETDDVVGVMSAVEKSELAFKTLLAVRGKLMNAYEEIRNMPI